MNRTMGLLLSSVNDPKIEEESKPAIKKGTSPDTLPNKQNKVIERIATSIISNRAPAKGSNFKWLNDTLNEAGVIFDYVGNSKGAHKFTKKHELLCEYAGSNITPYGLDVNTSIRDMAKINLKEPSKPKERQYRSHTAGHTYPDWTVQTSDKMPLCQVCHP